MLKHLLFREWSWSRALLAIALLPGLAGAADTNLLSKSSDNFENFTLEQLINYQVDSVFAASKYDQKVTRAPASVSIVTSDEIKKFGYRTLADVLRGTRSLYVTADRNYSNFGVRGFGRPGDFNTRLLLLVDGHRMNDNLYGAAQVGNEAVLDVDLIERVEIIRGPSSSIYGNSAFFGVINVVTRTGAKIDGAEGSVEGGSFDTYKGRFTFGKQFTNGLDLVVSGSLFDSGGQRRLYFPEFDQRISGNPAARNNGVARDADGENAQRLYGRLNYHDLTLSAGYLLRDKQVPTASFGTYFDDGREKTTDERIYADLKYEHAFSEDTQIMGRFSYDRNAYRADYPYNYGTPAAPSIVLNHDDNYGEGVGVEVQLTQRYFDRHTVVFGGEYREDLNLFLSNFDNDPKTYYLLNNSRGRSVGLYAQGEVAIRTNLLFNTGLRFDSYDRFGESLNPRLGLIYNPWEKTTFKLLYGQAFRAPNAYELYSLTPGYSKLNPDLKSETIRTYELVYEQYLPHNLRFSLSGYYYDIQDLISQNLDPADDLLVFQNVDSVTAKGVEAELEGRYAHGLLARASYAWQRAEDGATGQELDNSPQHLVKLNLLLPLYREYLYAGLELQYTSGLKTLANNRTSGFFVANTTLFSQQLAKNLEISASVYNLLDTKYAYPGSTGNRQDVIPQDGRSLRIKMTYKF